MNKCKDCRLWKPETNDFHWMGKCIDLTESALVIVSEMHPKMPILTHRYFGCVHFEEKKNEPFSIEKHESKTYDSWHIAFCDQIGPTLFPIQKVAKRWCNWLNELWAEKEKEPLDKNCPDCTSFPCWTHQFFTGHAEFCCSKFDRRGLLNCGTYPNCGHNTCPCDKWNPKV